MNRGHEIGCPALRNGVPCTCWVPPTPLKLTSRDAVIKPANLRIHELEIEWRGLQDMAKSQRDYYIWLEEDIARTGEASPSD